MSGFLFASGRNVLSYPSFPTEGGAPSIYSILYQPT